MLINILDNDVNINILTCMLILLCIWSSKSINCGFVMAPKKARGISMEVVVHQE